MGEVVVEWRRAYGVRPPPMTDTHPHWPLISLDSRYQGLKIPESESLRDTANRVSLSLRFVSAVIVAVVVVVVVAPDDLRWPVRQEKIPKYLRAE